MRTMKMEFWILYMDHVYDKPVTIASELRTKATTMQQGKIDNIHILKYLKDFQVSFCYPHYLVTLISIREAFTVSNEQAEVSVVQILVPHIKH